jgi:hypothetical protein
MYGQFYDLTHILTFFRRFSDLNDIDFVRRQPTGDPEEDSFLLRDGALYEQDLIMQGILSAEERALALKVYNED